MRRTQNKCTNVGILGEMTSYSCNEKSLECRLRAKLILILHALLLLNFLVAEQVTSNNVTSCRQL